LIDQLASDLEPVTPIAPVPRMLALVFAAVAVAAIPAFALYGLRPGFVDGFLSDVTYASVLVGLVLAVGGASAAALGSAIPGREALVRNGAGLAVGGLLLAIAVAAGMTPWGTAHFEEPIAQLACVARGCAFAVLPAVAVLALAARGWTGRPDWTVALGLLGTGAAGALLVHLTCPAIDPLHVLYTHTSTPVLVTLVLTAALTPLMRRLAR
jgi:hypothetical protein